jgi:hypothetical protein
MILEAGLPTEKPLVHVGQRNPGSGADLGTETALNALADEARFWLPVDIENF